MLKWLGGGASSAGGNSSNGAENMTHVGKVFTVNDYQVVVEELIAEGGFAVVYKTRSNRGKTYALKRMAVNNDHNLYLAKQEIAITKALSDCPHSVTYISSSIHSISPDVHEVLILMQLYTGPSVVDLLNARLTKRSRLSEKEVMKIFSAVVVAVGRLHHRTKPIIHRDLKIENILSDGSNNYILCDYGSCTVNSMHPETMGAARCEDEIARFTTLAYRAPEMVSLYSGKTISTKSDIWALGCLLYKLCFMTTPFGEQPLAIVSAQFTIPQNSPYSEDLHSLIRYMLEADPEKRPNIWQVSDVICRMQGKPNILPNVFRSPKPPAVLPRARKANENKTTPTTNEVKKKAVLSTPNSTKNAAKVTTTSISSRERPRARAAGLGPTLASKTVSTPSNATASMVLIRQHSNSPPAKTRPISRLEMTASHEVQHLSVDPQQRAQSKSWDSGLDMFGAVPFSTPSKQVPALASETTSTNMSDVRCDLFGSTPFSYASSPPPAHTQHREHSHPAATTQSVDDFGATPFVTCS